LLAFNGEVRDQASGWYLLGQGYRAYNPTLMRFHSPDSLSPFGAGGVNPYGYCQGNPIAFQDPTGHSVGKLEHRIFNVNKSALVTGLLMTAVFTGLAVASLGTATPFIMAVTVLGTGAMITGTGFKTAALLNHDPEEQQRLYQIGDAFDKVALYLGLAQTASAAGKGMLKSIGSKDIGTQTARSFPAPNISFPKTRQIARPARRIDYSLFEPKSASKTSSIATGKSATSLSSTTSSSISSSSSSSRSMPDMDEAIQLTKNSPVPLPAPAPAQTLAPVKTGDGMKYPASIPTPGSATFSYGATNNNIRTT